MVWLEGFVRIEYDFYVRGLEEKKLLTDKGIEYWMARDLMSLLAYEKWDNFEKTIEKARSACAASQIDPNHHFLETGNMVQIGSGAQRERGDWFLSRYACYLIAMNADASKQEVGHAMTYFAGQTRRQELHDQIAEQEKRLAVRLRLMENNHRLAGAAKNAGVIRYPIFQDAGHRGLYEMSLAEVKAHKGLLPSQELLAARV